MAEQTSNQFKSNGSLYTFIVTFIGTNIDGKKFNPIVLDNSQIEVFKYENQLNQFYLKGELSCVDSLGRIDRLLDKRGIQCTVSFIKMEEKFDGGFSLPKFSDKVYFQHTFLVENISILDRNNSILKYKVTLSGINILKCNANITFSNYAFDEKNKTLLNTLKSCIAAVNLTVDQKAFDNIDTSIKTNFITNGNDNIQTIAKYILNKMFYTGKDNSLKFIRYNETTDTFMMYDIKDKNQALGIYSIMLSMMNSDKESMVSQIPTNLGTVTRFPQSKTIKTFFTHVFKDYDYNQNYFFDRTIQSNTIENYINTTVQASNIEKKFSYELETNSLNYSIKGSIWNNDFSIYDNVVNILTKNNSLVINCAGNILRRPGDYVTVTIDRDIANLPSEKRAELEDIMLRYQGLEGIWNIFRTTHIIEPSKNRYTQNLVLMRNFTIKQQ